MYEISHLMQQMASLIRLCLIHPNASTNTHHYTRGQSRLMVFFYIFISSYLLNCLSINDLTQKIQPNQGIWLTFIFEWTVNGFNDTHGDAIEIIWCCHLLVMHISLRFFCYYLLIFQCNIMKYVVDKSHKFGSLQHIRIGGSKLF